MRKLINAIKESESAPKIVKNVFDKNEINEFLKLYQDLPITVHNKKQNVIKKRWIQGYNTKLENIFQERLEREIGNFKMDNLKDEKGKDILGLIQESYAPIGLHVDGGFELNNQIYKQSLIPLSSVGSTVIFKNRYYEESTSFTQDPEELKKTNLKYGQNKRSSIHLEMYGNKPFDRKIRKIFTSWKYRQFKRFRSWTNIWMGSWIMLIFDRTHLHCSSSIIEGKKIGIATFTRR